MSISDGQRVRASTDNNAFLSKTDVSSSNTTSGIIGLNNTSNADSGGAIVNTQRAINETMDTVGMTGEGDATRKNYSSNNYVTGGDNHKIAIGKLDAALASDASSLATHTSNPTIHFTESSIDHSNILNSGTNTHAQIDTHIASTLNPHSVTAAQVGNATAQWNANKIQGVDVAATAPSDGQALAYNSSTTQWEPQDQSGGGVGGINYIDNYDAEDGTTTGWVAYADGGATPTDGTGGTATATLTNTTTTPLRGTRSFLYTSGAQGDGISYDFTIDEADKNKAIYVSFDYATTGFTTGDLKFYAYNLTSGSMDELRGSASNGHATFIFYAGSNTSYRFVAHQTTANSFTFKFDNVRVGPDEIIDTEIETTPADYTPIVYEGTNNKSADFGTISATWTRKGQFLEIEGVLLGNANARSGTGIFGVGLPSGLTINTALLADPARHVPGYFSAGVGTPNDTIFALSAAPTRITAINKGTGAVRYDESGLNPTNAEISFYAKVPIAEWANETALLSNSKLLNTTNKAKFYLSAVQAIPTATTTTIAFNTTSFNTGNVSLNTSTGVVTINEAGYYLVIANATMVNLADGNDPGLSLWKNSTRIGLATSNVSATNQDPAFNVHAFEYFDKGHTIEAKLYHTYGSDRDAFAGLEYTHLSVIQVPDFSVYGAPWTYKLETATSSPFSLSTATYATGEYAQMSGNSVTLTEGVWKLSGGSKFIPGGSTTSLIIALWSLANGNDTTTAPTSISSVLTSGNDTMTYEPIAGFTVTKPMSEIVVTVTSETTVYLNHYVVFSVAGTASVTSYITAQRIRQ